MKRIALGLVAGLLMVACNSSTTSRPDSGGVMLMDSGMMMMGSDSGTRPDSGMMMMGGSCGSVTINMTDAQSLPAACTATPRCAMATLDAINMCTTGDCQNAALMGDMTPVVNTVSINGMAQPLNCATCFSVQQISCIFDSCPTETFGVLSCNAMTDADMCMGEEMALDACLTANEMAINTCANTEIIRCFAGGGGGGGEPEAGGAGGDAAREFGIDLHSAATIARLSSFAARL